MGMRSFRGKDTLSLTGITHPPAMAASCVKPSSRPRTCLWSATMFTTICKCGRETERQRDSGITLLTLFHSPVQPGGESRQSFQNGPPTAAPNSLVPPRFRSHPSPLLLCRNSPYLGPLLFSLSAETQPLQSSTCQPFHLKTNRGGQQTLNNACS